MRIPLMVMAALVATPLAAQAPDTTVSRARALAEAGAWHQAADLFQVALARHPADSTLLGETVDALEACGRWREAIPLLDRYLQLHAGDARRHWQRGLFGAWSGDRDVGVHHLRRAVALRPHEAEYLASLGEVLSWRPADRREARTHYQAALARDATNVRARVGMANLLVWSGRTLEALPEFDSILAEDPGHVGARSGKAGAFEQLQRYEEARELYAGSLRLSPGDWFLAARLARMELALGNVREAGRLVESLDQHVAPDVQFVRDSVRRAFGSSLSLGTDQVTREGQLDRRSVTAELSLAPADPFRIILTASPGQYHDASGTDRGNAFGGGASWRGPRFGVGGDIRYRDLSGVASAQWNGEVRAHWQTSKGIRVAAEWSRSPVEESRISTFGRAGGTQPRGPVHAELVTAAVAVDEVLGRVALRAEVLGGGYGGTGWERNERLGGGVEATVGVRASGPHLRIGYAFRTTSFAFNADTMLATAETRAAGYFSPRRYHTHQAVLQASHQVGGRLFWQLDGRVGEESVRRAAGESFTRRTAVTINTRVTTRVTSHLDLDVSYLYLDAFDAFRMHQARVGLRQFF